MLDKVGIGILVVGAAGIGGVVIVKPSWLSPNKSKSTETTPWKPLSQDTGFSTESGDYKDKFGSIYGNYFVGLNEFNNDWWNKSFEQLKKDNTEGNFKYSSNTQESKIDTAISTTAKEKGLNQICNEVYKSETSDISSTGAYKEKDVWKYCSPLGNKPTTITSSEHAVPTWGPGPGRGAQGPNQTVMAKLISTIGNDLFWEIRNKEFKGLDGYGKIEESKDDFFNPEKQETIRDLCKEAYKLDHTKVDGSITPKIFKYCSLDKKEPNNVR